MAQSPHDPSLTGQEEVDLMRSLRRKRQAEEPGAEDHLTVGQRIADNVAAVVGSWRFIIGQSILLMAWVIVNTIGWIKAWDPYPFILMNLMLSFQAAYTAPMIMMSQNRQAEGDRRNAAYDFEVNLKAEHEIKALHNNINLLQQQIERLQTQELGELTRLVRELHARRAPTEQPGR